MPLEGEERGKNEKKEERNYLSCLSIGSVWVGCLGVFYPVGIKGNEKGEEMKRKEKIT
jgi:hypothetical protein